MGKKGDIAAVLAANVERLMKAKEINSDQELSGKGSSVKVSQKTINNIKNSRHDPQLSSIAKLSTALGVEPYQLLIPMDDEKFLAVLIAWSKIKPGGRELILAATETALRRYGVGGETDDAATAQRR